MTQYLITEAQRGLLEDLCCRGPRPLWEMVRDLEPVKPLTDADIKSLWRPKDGNAKVTDFARAIERRILGETKSKELTP